MKVYLRVLIANDLPVPSVVSVYIDSDQQPSIRNFARTPATLTEAEGATFEEANAAMLTKVQAYVHLRWTLQYLQQHTVPASVGARVPR